MKNSLGKGSDFWPSGIVEIRLSAMAIPLRAGAIGLAILALLQSCQPGEKRRARSPSPAARIVVAVYTEVDGVSFSTDGSPYARFTDFLEREQCIRLTETEMGTLVDALQREGFFRETDRVLTGKARSASPAVFRICVAAPGRSKECVFLCEHGLQVPAPYRDIFSTLPIPRIPGPLDRFLQLNVQCDR